MAATEKALSGPSDYERGLTAGLRIAVTTLRAKADRRARIAGDDDEAVLALREHADVLERTNNVA